MIGDYNRSHQGHMAPKNSAHHLRTLVFQHNRLKADKRSTYYTRFEWNNSAHSDHRDNWFAGRLKDNRETLRNRRQAGTSEQNHQSTIVDVRSPLDKVSKAQVRYPLDRHGMLAHPKHKATLHLEPQHLEPPRLEPPRLEQR